MERPIPSTAIRCASVASLIVLPHSAFAAFNFATCATSDWDTAVPTEIGASEYVKLSTSPAGGQGDMTQYNVMTNQYWNVLTNPNVAALQPWFGHFVTELNYDYVVVAAADRLYTYTGAINSSATTLLRSTDSWNIVQGAVSGVRYGWKSDGDTTGDIPPTIAQVTPRCKTGQSTAASNNIPLSPNTRSDGLLIKTGDVIYFNITQPANHTMIVRLDSLAATPGADFDLYVSSTSSLPDDSNFQWRGFSSSQSEALLIPATTGPRGLYIGVHSFSGSGHFALSADITTMAPVQNVCITDAMLTGHPTLTSTQLTALRAFIQSGSAYLYSFTNGIALRYAYNINTDWTGTCNFANTACDVCIVNDTSNISSGGPVADRMVGHIEMHGGNWGLGAPQGWLFAHESGHSCFGLADEYQPPPAGDNSAGLCGHTAMANHSKATAFCSMNHCLDGQVVDTSKCNPANPSNWQTVKASASWAANYVGPDFSNATTTYPTPSWNNPNLVSLIRANF